MLIERTFTTAETESSARHYIGKYLEAQGYRQVATEPDLVYQRGSGLGTWTSFSIKKWKAVATVRTAANPDQTTQVYLNLDVDTSGQMVVKREMDAWQQEVEGLVASVKGQGADVAPLYQEATQMQAKQVASSGAQWFFWIAALSALNSLITALQGGWSFLVGLGITQFIDGLAAAFLEAGAPSTAVRLIALGMDLAVAGLFLVFGFLARRSKAGFVVGMVIYALDALLFLWVQDYLSFAFHLYVLYMLFRGLKAFSQLKAAPVDATPSAPAGLPPTPSDAA